MLKKRVVIIGAGPAGLTAGYELLEKGHYEVVILEESNEIGGISRTINYKGNRMDIGGHRFFSKNQRVMDWWHLFMTVEGGSINGKEEKSYVPDGSAGADPEIEDLVLLIRKRVSRIFYLRKFFDYPLSLKWQTVSNLGVMRTLHSGFSYIGAQLFRRNEQSLEDFFINRFGKKLYRMFFEKYTEKIWGVHPSNISPEWGAQRIKGLSISKLIADVIIKTLRRNSDISQKNVETSLIERFLYPKYGPGQLWETVAERIDSMGGVIKLNSKVTNVNLAGDCVRSVSYETAGEMKEEVGDVIISSMPIKDLIECFNGVSVPKDVAAVSSNLPYRDFITVGILANKLLLNSESKGTPIEDCWIYIQEEDVRVGRMQIFNNWSPYMVQNAKDTVWIGLEYFCNEGDELWSMDNEHLIQFAAEEISKIGVICKEHILDSVCIKVKKAYPAYFGSYNKLSSVIEYLDTVRNLYCIGRNGQHRYNNMDHSMMTAFAAVESIEKMDADRKRIWSVNSETEYHETRTA